MSVAPPVTPETDSGFAIIEGVSTKKGKTLLHPMYIDFPEGEIVALMGPSGAGKSVLLDFVTCSMQSNVIANGEVSLPGTLSYVPQDDRLHGFYTVKGYMQHYSRLSGITGLGATGMCGGAGKKDSPSKEEVDKNIDEIIDALGLGNHKNTIVGDIFRRGLSGGQKRRLSIGLEALSNPKNLFLDEPTSGLDSESALAVLKYLKTYVTAAPGRRVILTIHQPSSFIWELIDRVVLLSKGNLVYQGARSKMEDFFSYAGSPTPPMYNPADHYLAVVNTDFVLGEKSPAEWHASFKEWRKTHETKSQLQKAKVRGSAYEAKSHRKLIVDDTGDIEEQATTAAAAQDATPKTMDGTHKSRLSIIRAIIPQQELQSYRTNGFVATMEMTHRYMLNLIYNPGILGTRVAMYCMLSIIIGALFWDLGSVSTYTSITTRMALLFYNVSFFVFMSVAVLPFTVMERGIIDKEVRNGYYHPVFYQAAQAIAAIPGTALLAFLTTIIICSMTGLREPYWYFLNMFLALNVAEAIAQLMSHVVPHFIIGMACVAACYGFFMLLEGFVLIPSEFPDWLRWTYNIGLHTYSWRTFCYMEYHGQYYEDAGMSGDEVLETFEILDVVPRNDMIVLVGYAAVVHLLSFIFLWGKHAWHQRGNANQV